MWVWLDPNKINEAEIVTAANQTKYVFASAGTDGTRAGFHCRSRYGTSTKQHL